MALQLSPAQARIVAALVEKSITTPQYFPMSVNAVMLAANQKSCRHPAMSLSEGEVGATLNDLAELKFAERDEHSGRVIKWRHRFQHQMLLRPDTLAVLVTLMLRGPQTASELRTHAAGLAGPADAAGMNAAIEDLADRAEPLLVLLPRAPGQKEARYAHTLCGAPAAGVSLDPEPVHAKPVAADESGALEARVRALEARVAELERRIAGTPPANPEADVA